MTMRHWKRITNEDTRGLFRFFKYQKCPKIPKFLFGNPRWNMVSPVIFAGALTIFAGALPPWASPWWRGRVLIKAFKSCSKLLQVRQYGASTLVECKKILWRPGLHPGPRWESLQRFHRPLATERELAAPSKNFTLAVLSAFQASGFGPSGIAADPPVNFSHFSYLDITALLQINIQQVYFLYRT